MPILLASVIVPASAQNPPPTCPAPSHTQVFHSLQDLSYDVRSALLAKTPDIVDSNQPFDPTDVVMHGAHFNRFAFAWQANGRWIIATEHGGIAYYNPIYTVVSPPSPASTGPFITYAARILKTTMSRPTALCPDARHALDEKLPPVPPAKPKYVTHG
ncbi:hypothetical protein [Terriglobus sp.]|uniref:hypothetical protein n=1 Tax=Terriglobus sp. TaxID=1889013 RepID=UPI003B001D6E